MEQKLISYVDFLFRNAPRTKESIDFREEVLQNINDKYTDLIRQGLSKDEAINKSISSLGNIEKVISELKDEELEMYPREEIMKSKKKSAILVSTAVGIYILSPLAIILFSEVKMYTTGLVIMFALIAIATGMLIYNSYTKIEEKHSNVVEDFREYRYNNSNRGRREKSINSIIWSIGLIVYFLVSFLTGAWHISWIIFIITGVCQKIVRLIME